VSIRANVRTTRRILSSASTVSDDDAVLDAAGADGIPFELALKDMSDLLNLLLRADGSAFERCFLSDTHGAPGRARWRRTSHRRPVVRPSKSAQLGVLPCFKNRSAPCYPRTTAMRRRRRPPV